MANVYDKLKENGITLPAAPAKGGIYTPVQEFGPGLRRITPKRWLRPSQR